MSKIRIANGHTRTDARQMHLTLQEVADMLDLTSGKSSRLRALSRLIY
ncbi:hypothetical protein [Polynucleobacter sp.]|nr:hypothetical protein [Polynucleobacter sp.]MDP3122395.1 hypothetical protein [Polynucleobacter sp.]